MIIANGSFRSSKRADVRFRRWSTDTWWSSRVLSRTGMSWIHSTRRTRHPECSGSLQLEWLSRVLDQHRDKPALVMVHHQPDHSDEPSGLVDTKPLLDLLAAHSHVQVLYFGHTHRWQVTVSDLNRAGGSGVHQVNLPPTAYIFQEGDPCGWVDAAIRADGITLTLNCIDKKHALHGTSHSLTWK